MQRRVAITGIGVISAIGNTRAEFFESLRNAASGIRPITSLPPGSVKFPNAAEIQNYNPLNHFSEKDAGFLDRFAQLAVVAAREAVAHSGIQFDDELKASAAIVTGSCIGGQSTEDEGFYGLYALKNTRFAPLSIPKVMANAGASRISLEYGITGPVYTVSTACSSSNHALGQAFWLVRNGIADAAIAGGSEAPFSLGLLKAWEAMRVVSPDTCRPFSRDRKGLVLGEGAAMLLLEPWEKACERGATVLGEILGFGMSSDAHHITQPSAAGAAKAMKSALLDAALNPDQIGYINAHGTGTPANDPTETEAIHAVFGEHARKLAVSSTKSTHGHTLGAAGAMEAAATLFALREGILPPTANFTEPDPACDLDVVPNTARAAHVQFALSNSFAFGGLNAVLVFGKGQ